MSIELNEQQQRSLDEASGDPPEVVDPRTKTTYVLVPAGDYETVREVLEEERQQQALRKVGRRNAIGRMDEEP